ncbi:hypothetical protein ACFQJ7_01095 [Halovenus rubra]|uniref:Uncharacterized protein n=2 Tax=Halovenus rubra TaxID=869890 RepID=A0ABD5X0C7_9EURY|nr:hypothetical protein [Halovenus rubra]
MVDSMDSSTETNRAVTEKTGDGSLDATGVYETASGIVLYDTEKPLAWIQSDNAVRLDEVV